MYRDETQAAEAVMRETGGCIQRVHDLGCPVETRVGNRLPEMMARGLRDEAVEMAVDAAHIGVFCSRSCPAVDPLLGIINGTAPCGGLPEGVEAVAPRRLPSLPADASEPARHAFLLVRAAYRLRQARTAPGLWQAIDGNVGCWIALRTAVEDGRIGLPEARRRQILHYARYVEHMTRVTHPMSDHLVEAFIRLARSAAAWLTEEATDRAAEQQYPQGLAAE